MKDKFGVEFFGDEQLQKRVHSAIILGWHGFCLSPVNKVWTLHGRRPETPKDGTREVLPDDIKPRLNGFELITAERRRQIEELGYTPHRDQKYDESRDLVLATVAYLKPCCPFKLGVIRHSGAVQDPWPWDNEFDKRGKYSKDPIRLLTIAGAWIAAEIDRLQLKAEIEAGTKVALNPTDEKDTYDQPDVPSNFLDSGFLDSGR